MITHDTLPDEVFVSYKRERRAVAEHLTNVIQAHGYKVWYDYGLITGHDFAPQIERKLVAAKVVLVLWCTRSVASKWVLREATIGRERGLLTDIMIEPCVLPEGFASHHHVTLADWDGSPRSHLLDQLWDAIEARTGREPTGMKQVRAYERTWRCLNAISLKSMIQSSAAEPAGGPDADVPPVSCAVTQSESDALQAATRAWLAVRDTGDLARLADFEREFADTRFAEQARALRQAQEPIARPSTLPDALADVRRDRLRAEGRIALSVPVVHGAPIVDGQGWFLPRSGATEWFRDHRLSPEMVVVPAGEFTLGSNDRRQEGPPRSVVVTRPFAVSRCAVTVADWDGARDVGGVTHRPDTMGWEGKQRPIIDVSWHDAVVYCDWLSRVTGLSYRLLTEAEWEYVARAGTHTPYWQGRAIGAGDANFDHGLVNGVEPPRRTCPAGDFAPNPWGLYQTQGNVWEWVADAWHGDHGPVTSALSGPVERRGGDTTCRAVRGGAWSSSADALRASNRERFPVDHRDYNIGFRVMRSL